jgi:hypothetical protein
MRLSKAEIERRTRIVVEEAKRLGDNATVMAIVKVCGFSRDFVERTLIENDCKYEKSYNKKWTPEAIDEMVNQLNEGASYCEVGVKYGITKQRVSEVLKRNGYTLKFVKDDKPVIRRRLR